MFLVLGVGPITSRFLWEALKVQKTTIVEGKKIIDYRTLLLYPAGAAVIGAVLLLLFFHPPKKLSETTGDVALPH